MRAEVELLEPDEARDRAFVEELVRVINEAYAVGEAGLWREGAARTNPGEIWAAIRSGGMLAARHDGRLVGCAYVYPLEADLADLGLLAVATDHWGGGAGGELVRSAEALMRSRGVTTMQLELLVPKEGVHPEKERLRAWYTRIGYRVSESAPFDQVAPHLESQLATQCEFLILRKPLTDTPG